jgi:rRNA maturation protein Rpf1
MGQLPQSILITTTHQASEEARSLCKVLEHVIPESYYLSRGSKSIKEISEIATQNDVEYVFICSSKGSMVSEILFYVLQGEGLNRLDYKLKIYEYVDYKIFGWKSLPEKGPLSVSREIRNSNPELIDFLEKIFRITVGKKTSLWLLLDDNELESYLQFVDALTVKPFTHLRIRIVKEKSK